MALCLEPTSKLALLLSKSTFKSTLAVAAAALGVASLLRSFRVKPQPMEDSEASSENRDACSEGSETSSEDGEDKASRRLQWWQQLNEVKPELLLPKPQAAEAASQPLQQLLPLATLPQPAMHSAHAAVVGVAESRMSRGKDSLLRGSDYVVMPGRVPAHAAIKARVNDALVQSLREEFGHSFPALLTGDPNCVALLLDTPTFGTVRNLATAFPELRCCQQLVVPQADLEHYFEMVRSIEFYIGVRAQRLDHWLCANADDRTLPASSTSKAQLRCLVAFLDFECRLVGRLSSRLCPAADVMRYFRFGYPADPVSVLALTVGLEAPAASPEEVDAFIRQEAALNGYIAELREVWKYRLVTLLYVVRRERPGKSLSLVEQPLQKEPTPLEQWTSPSALTVDAVVTEELIQNARQAFGRLDKVYLHHLVSLSFPHLKATKASTKAVRRGVISVDGVMMRSHDALAPAIGAVISAELCPLDVLANLEQRFQALNAKSRRPEAQVRILCISAGAAWAVVNKPVGLHCDPSGGNANYLCLEAFLPILLPPPQQGTPCRGPQVCHHLDFRVSGPVVVAMSEDMKRGIRESFEAGCVHKEFRAILCGSVGKQGDTFVVHAELDGETARMGVEVLRVVPCPHYSSISEVTLHPQTQQPHLLRRLCSEVLGAPVVNEEPSLFARAAPAWERRFAYPLPAMVTRGRGNLFLQAVLISLPVPGAADNELVYSRVDVSESFERLLRTSEHAWQEGWRTDGAGQLHRIQL